MNLKDKLENITRLSFEQKTGLKKIGVQTVEDILRYYPARYGDSTEATTIQLASKGDEVTLFGRITRLETSKGFKSKIPMAKGVLMDETGSIGIVWFSQAYIAKMIHEGALVRVEGKVSEGKNGKYLTNPKIDEIQKIPNIKGQTLFIGDEIDSTLYPVYPETKGITSNWIYYTIQKIFKSGLIDMLTDPIPEEMLKRYSLPTLSTALIWAHSPRRKGDYEIARKRFAFEEIFLIQLQKQIERRKLIDLPSTKIKDAKVKANEFIERLPFTLTEAQTTVIDSICKELERGVPMSRLLEGDVGSGKTAVAAATSYAVVKSHPEGRDFGNLQVAYMAPTEILATQHFESFIEFFKHLPIEIVLMTGSTCRKFPSKVDPSGYTQISKAQASKWIEEGKISLTIGTHALIQKKVKFKNLAYVIIDEQHRFGVNQRQKLARKDGVVPHLLSMTATPIPRTLALTIYGDLDLSVLDQMPSGRKPIITDIVLPNKRDEVYEKIRTELKAGRQAYIICPRIDAPDLPDMPLKSTWQEYEHTSKSDEVKSSRVASRRQAGPDKEQTLQLKSVVEEAERLRKTIFKEYRIDILHSKMTPKEKDETMNDFYEGRIDILVSTSVVEVGVNVPNANIIVIEGGERFGLSQLHQLRGRVLRGTHQGHCFVFAESKSDKSIERLKAFKNAKNGFELAELDMTQRGAGGLSGGKQWGVSDIAMEALRNIKMVEAAREEAKLLVEKNNLKLYPHLAQYIESKKEVHFE